MANIHKRKMSKRRQQQLRRQKILIAACGVLALALIITGVKLLTSGGKDKYVPAMSNVAQNPADGGAAALKQRPEGEDAGMDTMERNPSQADNSEPSQAPFNTKIPQPTQGPSDTVTLDAAPTKFEAGPVPAAWQANRQYIPQAKEGWLPVFKKSATEEKIIAITVDDCFQAGNLRKIIDKAMECGGKLTIFPIGKNAIRESQAESLRYAWQNGFELENHTYTHSGLFDVTDEKLAEEIYRQNLALSYILNVDYHAHFIRPRGGDARDDQRMHAYAKQMDYYGVAHWSIGGSGSSVNALKKSLKPGEIYLFHTTNNDLKTLLEFIPYATEQGYRLVTLNEMFGLPENEYKELTKPIQEYKTPPLQPYNRTLVPFKKGSYAYGVKLMQEKLVALKYLGDEPDGSFGPNTEKAVKKLQQAAGMEVTGVADVALQEYLFAQ